MAAAALASSPWRPAPAKHGTGGMPAGAKKMLHRVGTGPRPRARRLAAKKGADSDWDALDAELRGMRAASGERTVLGVDYGRRRTGLAVSAGGLAPRPLAVVPSFPPHELLAAVIAAALRERCDEIVVGLPVPPGKPMPPGRGRKGAGGGAGAGAGAGGGAGARRRSGPRILRGGGAPAAEAAEAAAARRASDVDGGAGERDGGNAVAAAPDGAVAGSGGGGGGGEPEAEPPNGGASCSDASAGAGGLDLLDLTQHSTAAALEALGKDALREDLKRRGLKSGGTLGESAERLLVLARVGGNLSKLDSKMFAKKKKQTPAGAGTGVGAGRGGGRDGVGGVRGEGRVGCGSGGRVDGGGGDDGLGGGVGGAVRTNKFGGIGWNKAKPQSAAASAAASRPPVQMHLICTRFAENLADAAAAHGLPVKMYNEALTSKEAELNVLASRGGRITESMHDEHLDDVSAAILLERYFARRDGPPIDIAPQGSTAKRR